MSASTSSQRTLEQELTAIVGGAHVLTDRDVVAGYETDYTGRFSGTALAVVRPANTDQVARVVRACADHGAAIVPQGGNTGLVGGAVPRDGAVVLALGRLDELGPVDDDAGQVVAGAGTTLDRLHQHARASGWAFGVDHGARSAATVGGMIATNAGGSQVLRHGTMRAQVAGLEVVLADGSVLRRLGGLAKDATGYDLSGLMCGSEGTLGIVTAARLRLVPPAGPRITALFGVADAEAALVVFRAVRSVLPALEAAEFFDRSGLELVRRHRGLAAPFPGEYAVYLLLEADGGEAALELLAEAVEDLAEVGDVAAGTDAATRTSLWAYRELQNEAIAAEGMPHKLDVSLPLSSLAAFLAQVPDTVRAAAADETSPSEARCIVFGHLGDGNVHVNVLGLSADDVAVDEAVLRLTASLGGSIGAEHGIGVAKAPWLPLSRSPAEIAAMRAIKAALDPCSVLNPGVLLTPHEQAAGVSTDRRAGRPAP